MEANGLTVAIALAAAIAAALAAQTFGRPPPPTIEVRPLEPQPTVALPFYVHVEGAVESPGVYNLPPGARVFEAIDSAGGATDDADVSALNLAAPVADGQKLVVPSRPSAAPPGAATAAASAPASPTPQGRASAARINVKMLSSQSGLILRWVPSSGERNSPAGGLSGDAQFTTITNGTGFDRSMIGGLTRFGLRGWILTR